uniref:LEM domain-containing protein n=1 Tax=Graphocephala atropunctata TaxID=36148 RepID=A0A1B6MB33_9HEMI
MWSEVDRVKLHPSPSFSEIARDWVLSSALYDGIEDEDIRQIQTLLAEKRANPNVLLAEYGITPFHFVVANESTTFAVQATNICLQHGADPNVRSEDGLTPVHLAAMWGCADVLRVLLAKGGDPWLVDCFNKNAFQYAQSEGQHECYNILTRHCNPKHRPPSRSETPYQLNLKHVILQKNDLQIVYEASPPGSHRCASTQTSSKQSEVDPAMEALRIFSGIQNISDKASRRSSTDENRKERLTGYLEKKEKKEINGDGKDSDFGHVNVNSNYLALDSKLKEVIVRHRRNSAIYEYSPTEPTQDSSSSGVTSWEDFGKSQVTSSVSELIEKLEKTNVFRQSLKLKENHNDKLRNVTQRKKTHSQQNTSTVSKQSVSSYQSCEKMNSRNSIGFVFDDSKPNSSVLPSHGETVESPPSIGFILDNLDEVTPRTRGSSLFSDIGSDVEAFSTPGQQMDGSEIMTEDENFAEEKHFTKRSSSDSLYPYVSCEEVSTRECETSECFESCVGGASSMPEANSTSLLQTPENGCESLLNRSVSQGVHSVMDTILDNIDGDKRTPVNPRLVTSTPERLGCGSDRGSCSTDSEKRRWVEAEVVSSDEEPCVSVSEEYEYTDLDEGVVLIEKRYLLNNYSGSVASKESKKSNVPSSTSEESEVSTVSGSDAAYDTDQLRRALCDHGFSPGPITGNTKRVYLRKLKRCKRHPPAPPPVGQPGQCSCRVCCM